MKSFRVLQVNLVIVFAVILISALGWLQPVLGQAMKNPVLEFCTGTWCPWCPCGHTVIHHDILPQMPNAIILAYHGWANYALEPFSFFNGNSILSALGFSGYPSGIVDRVSGIISRNRWQAEMNARANWPTMVTIDMVKKGYNPFTRQFHATINFTPVIDLRGEYKYNIILVEDSLVYTQASRYECTPGQTSIPNYVHDSVVRDMMNGALGQEVITGAWKKDQVITRIFDYTIPDLSNRVRDLIPKNCKIVVLIYQVGAPLSSSAEIQQAEQWPLMAPGYAALLQSERFKTLASHTISTEYKAVLKNVGVHPDTFNLELKAPDITGWSAAFTTVHGTFSADQSDVLSLNAGDSTQITVILNPNAIAGVGQTTLQFLSTNFITGSVTWELVTHGLDFLVVDDDDSTFESYLTKALDRSDAKDYGHVSSQMLLNAGAAINSFGNLFWLCAAANPGLSPGEQTALISYLDQGGRLYLSGLDVAYQLADSSSPYFTPASLEFFSKYLHAAYIKRESDAFIVEGIPDDPIGGGFGPIGIRGGSGANTIEPRQGRYANQIAPADSTAWPIFHYFQKAAEFCGIRAVHPAPMKPDQIGKVVFTTFGFESLARDSDREKLIQSIVNWLQAPSAVRPEDLTPFPDHYILLQNYPNPFNPVTRISYQLPSISGHRVVELSIFNSLGQKIRTLIREVQPAGKYEIEWNGLDDAGQRVGSGIYLAKIHYGALSQSLKLILLK